MEDKTFMKNESLIQAKEAYKIEAECITNMLDYFDEEALPIPLHPAP